ncbi:MAG: aspartate aminotransferase family protein [Lachnospiraceae bacterium]|nr:aspartate aminotransferase family protein [Lachnospiraceae bacterium]
MSMQSLIDEGEKYLLHTYNRYQIALDKGEGVKLYDLDGKEYLDFCAGIAVFALGYGNKEYNDALKAQIDKLLHTSNYYYSKPAIEAAKRLVEISGLSRVFFTNSGAEAIEGAVKAAKRYAYNKNGNVDHEIIAFEHSFHGRTLGALSVTGNEKYRAPFIAENSVKFAEYNNLESVKSLVNDKTCAIIMETVQGEGGIYPAEEDFIKGVRALCDEKDIVLILDEIQCGMGRTGKMFAYEYYGVKPDIATVAKAVGCGVPVGAFLLNEKLAENSLVPGDHGTTYGGNPFATTAINAVLDQFEKLNILDNVCKVSTYLEEKLDELVNEYDFLTGRRGKGLMQGIVFDDSKKTPGEVVKNALNNGLILITAGKDVLRFLPPLIITEEDVDCMIEKLKASF